MSKIRVHELAKELGRQNREVIEVLKAKGMDVKSHMSNIEEPYVSIVKEKFGLAGKEQVIKLDNTPKTEEKVVTANTEAEKAEAPKKKKISFVYIMHRMQAMEEKAGEGLIRRNARADPVLRAAVLRSALYRQNLRRQRLLSRRRQNLKHRQQRNRQLL